MCNPRRVQVTATRQLNEAWQREVSRSVALRANVRGEARVRQPLGATLGTQALRALESALAAEGSGWAEVEEGFRHDVEGGYVIYHVDERELEIVAVLEDEVQAEAKATRRLEGQVEAELSAEGEGQYYDDGWGGRDQAAGEKAARERAEQNLNAAARARLEQAASEAETQASATIEAAAHAKAEEILRQQAVQRQAALDAQARQHLETVGLRARQAFHQMLARAYRDAILAYARMNQAEGIQCTDEGDVIEIQFNLQR